MKRTKACLLAIWAAVAAMTLAACDHDDSYRYDFSYVVPTALVTVKPDTAGGPCLLQLDDSTALQPVNMPQSPFGDKEVRALASFEYVNRPLHGQLPGVRIYWIDSILTKPTAPNLGADNDSAYGDEPIEIVNSWETVAEDGYLTLRFRTRWTPGRTHRVNLVHRTDSAARPWLLRLYHDAGGGAAAGEVADGIVAFRLGDGFNRPDSTIEIELQWKSYSGMKSHTFKYRPRKPTATTH